eukprot:scaffold1672_cov366-Prasinococcus_capsulatus_cf.AAC.7
MNGTLLVAVSELSSVLVGLRPLQGSRTPCPPAHRPLLPATLREQRPGPVGRRSLARSTCGGALLRDARGQPQASGARRGDGAAGRADARCGRAAAERRSRMIFWNFTANRPSPRHSRILTPVRRGLGPLMHPRHIYQRPNINYPFNYIRPYKP